MGNICFGYDYHYNNFTEAKFSKCKKCHVNFRLPDRYYYARRSCSIHKIKKGRCVICNTQNLNTKCYHVEQPECIIS